MSSWKNAEKNRKRAEREARYEKELEAERAVERRLRDEKVDRYMPLLEAIENYVVAEIARRADSSFVASLKWRRQELLEAMVEILP